MLVAFFCKGRAPRRARKKNKATDLLPDRTFLPGRPIKMTYVGATGATGLPLPTPDSLLLVDRIGPQWSAGALRAEAKEPYRAYHRVEWPGPAPGAWDYSVFSSPTNPGNAVSVTSRCTIDLIYEGACDGDASCTLGILDAGDTGAVNLATAPGLDPAQFRLGQTMHRRCVNDKVESYFGAWR